MIADASKFCVICLDCHYTRQFSTHAAVQACLLRHEERTGHKNSEMHWPQHDGYKLTTKVQKPIAKVSKRKKIRAQRVTGKLPGKRIQPKAGWREGVDRTVCICCSYMTVLTVVDPDTMEEKLTPCAIVDHLVPARWVLAMCPGKSAEPRENLNAMCLSCHGKKLRCEHYLHAANFVGFVRGLLQLNFPIRRIRDAFEYYGLSTAMLEGL